ncbi:MAG: SDR family oxidoreductase [Novosphingobium sp.]
MKRVLVVGGYGGFGLRLSRRLASDGWAVLVAGRDRAKAEAAARDLPGAEGVWFDRTGNCQVGLTALHPDLVIDAAGPFQTCDYGLPRACIAAAVPYFDLADARAFVCGIGELDADARKAGVPVISGASSVPALSAAVVHDLAQGLDRIAAIDTAISATTRASSGLAVVRAALSYAGQPIRLWRSGRWEAESGWSLARQVRFAAPGAAPLRRRVALAEVPDLELFPALYPGAPACTFRGGSEFGLQMRALGLLGWIVQRGWLRSAAPLASWLAPLQQGTARLGGQRSAMQVEVRGWAGTRPVLRRWTVIAEQGQGQEIPTFAAQLLARRLIAGQLQAGARTAAGELCLADFGDLFAGLPVSLGVEEETILPLYRRILGARFAALAPQLQALHQPLSECAAQGQASVARGKGPLAWLLGLVMQFPPAGDYPLEVRFVPQSGRERWTRHFGPHRFSSEMGEGPEGTLTERFGPMRFHFALDVDPAGALAMRLRGWSVLGLPMPLSLAPRIAAGEHGRDGRFHFDVAVTMPLIGPVVHYRGWLKP